MQKWCQQELKTRGFSRYKSRKAYGNKVVNGIEFFVRLNNDKYEKEQWFPEVGIVIPYPFNGKNTLAVFVFYHVYLGELNEEDGSTDIWTENDKDSLLQSLDSVIIPWIEHFSIIDNLIDHYLKRIENGIPRIKHKSELEDITLAGDVSEASLELRNFLSAQEPSPDTANKFWEHISIFYNQIGEYEKSLQAIGKYLEYQKRIHPVPVGFVAEKIDIIEQLINNNKWPTSKGI
jgi:hypothetical protein